jgi:hypothetical protein
VIERQFIVIAWFVAALLGIAVQILLIWDERQAMRALKRAGRNGPARIVAWGDVRTDAFGLAVMVIITAIAALAYVVVNRGTEPYSALEAWAVAYFWRVLGYGMLCVIALLVMKGAWKRRDRQLVMKTALAAEKTKP